MDQDRKQKAVVDLIRRATEPHSKYSGRIRRIIETHPQFLVQEVYSTVAYYDRIPETFVNYVDAETDSISRITFSRRIEVPLFDPPSNIYEIIEQMLASVAGMTPTIVVGGLSYAGVLFTDGTRIGLICSGPNVEARF